MCESRCIITCIAQTGTGWHRCPLCLCMSVHPLSTTCFPPAASRGAPGWRIWRSSWQGRPDCISLFNAAASYSSSTDLRETSWGRPISIKGNPAVLFSSLAPSLLHCHQEGRCITIYAYNDAPCKSSRCASRTQLNATQYREPVSIFMSSCFIYLGLLTNMPQLREHVLTFCSQPENNALPCRQQPLLSAQNHRTAPLQPPRTTSR
jgi:hypothetical protein